jgi:hypothetical protein
MENYEEVLARLDRLEQTQAEHATTLEAMSKIDSMIARLLRDLEGVEVGDE